MSSSSDFSGPGRELRQPRQTRHFPISRVAVAAPQLVWIMTIVLGMGMHRGNASSDTSSYLPCAWYDGISFTLGHFYPSYL